MLALGYFSFQDLMHDRWRSFLTVISLAVVVAASLLLTSLSRAMLTIGMQPLVTSNLVILKADAIDPMDSSLDAEILQTAMEIAPDQISRTFPTLFRHMNVGGRILQVRSAPLEEMSSTLALTLIQGDWPSGSRQVVAGEEIARVASWEIGSTVNIYGTDFQLVGIVRAAGNNHGAIWMTTAEGQRLFGMEHGFQAGYLPLNPLADPESVRDRLQADPRISAQYIVYLENALSNGYSEVNHNLVTLSSIMAIVSLLAIIFGIYNSTSLTLTERCHEIGLLRVIGFTQGKLRSFLLGRSLFLTLAAFGLGWVTMLIYFNYLNSQANLGFTEAPLILDITPLTFLLTLGLSLIFSFMGIWLTSGRIARLDPLTESE
jgi:ABC-type antimicrobial peptide transport system permease subunit